GMLLPARSTARARNWYVAPKRNRGSVPFWTVKEVSRWIPVLAGFCGSAGVESDPMVLPARGAQRLQPAQRKSDSGNRMSLVVPSADCEVATEVKPSSENVRVRGPSVNL